MQLDSQESQLLLYRKPPLNMKCPRCKSPDLVVVFKEGLLETLKVKFLKMNPYRCLDCDFRFIF